MNYSDFIQPEVLILVVAIYALGMLLKGLNKVKDGLIPWILLAFSLVLCILMLGFNVNAIVQGILVTAAAVYSNQLVKQTQEVINQNSGIDPTSNHSSNPPDYNNSQK